MLKIHPFRWHYTQRLKAPFPLYFLDLQFFEQLLFSTFFKVDRQSYLTPALVTQNSTPGARGKIPPTKAKKTSHQHQNSIYYNVLTPQYKNTVYYCIFFCFDFYHLRKCSFERNNHLKIVIFKQRWLNTHKTSHKIPIRHKNRRTNVRQNRFIAARMAVFSPFLYRKSCKCDTYSFYKK